MAIGYKGLRLLRIHIFAFFSHYVMSEALNTTSSLSLESIISMERAEKGKKAELKPIWNVSSLQSEDNTTKYTLWRFVYLFSYDFCLLQPNHNQVSCGTINSKSLDLPSSSFDILHLLSDSRAQLCHGGY